MEKTNKGFQAVNKDFLNKKLASYSALAGAFAAIAPATQGAVVYTDVNPDDTIQISPTLYQLDMNGDLIADFALRVGSYQIPYGTLLLDVNYALAVAGANNGIAGSTSMITTNSGAVYSFNLPYALGAGVQVGPGMVFNVDTQQAAHSMGAFVLNPPIPLIGNWADETDKFLGVRFQISGNTHYGWVRFDSKLSAGGGSPYLIIKDYAYDDVPNTPINTGAGLPIPADAATNVMGADIDDNGNGSDLRVTFNKAANENTVSEYRVMVVKSSASGSFDLAVAEAIGAANYTAVTPTGSNITAFLTAGTTDTDGDLITTLMPYKIFVLSVADGTVAQFNILSAPSPDITLTIPGQADPVTNIVAADVADNGDGTDLQVSFNKAADESKVGEYRVIVVKSADATGFNLTMAEAVAMANYTTVAKTGNNLSTVLSANANDKDGDAITLGVPYKVLVLTVADGVNANQNGLSQASNEVTLHIQVGNVSGVSALDIADNSNGTDLQVSFNRSADESQVSEYRILVVESGDAASFNLVAANAVAGSDYTAVTPTGSNITTALSATANDVNGNRIGIGTAYKVFVLAVANGVSATLNNLSAESNEVTLNTPTVAVTNVSVEDVGNNNDGTDLQVSFTKAPDEALVGSYRAFVVKSVSAATFDLATANSVVAGRYTTFNKTGNNISGVLAGNARDIDNDPVANGTAYKVFVLTMADGNNANINALSNASPEITLTDSTIIGIEDYKLAGVHVYGYLNNIFITSKVIEFNNAELTVYSVDGKAIIRTTITGKQAQIRLDNVSDGFYLVYLRTKNGLVTERVHISNQ